MRRLWSMVACCRLAPAPLVALLLSCAGAVPAPDRTAAAAAEWDHFAEHA